MNFNQRPLSCIKSLCHRTAPLYSVVSVADNGVTLLSGNAEEARRLPMRLRLHIELSSRRGDKMAISWISATFDTLIPTQSS